MERRTNDPVAPTAARMRRLGAMLGRHMSEGDVVGLVGPLGSGKTTFAQGIATGLGVPAERHVASPTFALMNEHAGRVTFVHADLYRIDHAVELAELGLDDAYARAACAIEWLDRFPEAAPADHLEITFTPGPQGRRLALRATGPRGRVLAAAFRKAACPGS